MGEREAAADLLRLMAEAAERWGERDEASRLRAGMPQCQLANPARRRSLQVVR